MIQAKINGQIVDLAEKPLFNSSYRRKIIKQTE